MWWKVKQRVFSVDFFADCELWECGSTKTQEKFVASVQGFKKRIQKCSGNFTNFPYIISYIFLMIILYKFASSIIIL